jgi:Branched-chain amino acid aminotransferase/4-amino-4-deoxychorismate lyase
MSSKPIAISRNGLLIEPADAHVHVANPAVMNALGVYETIQVVAGRPFCLEEHLARLARSARGIQLNIPAREAEIMAWTRDLIRHAGVKDALLRILAINGDAYSDASVYLLLLPSRTYPPRLYREGACAITFKGERALPTAKTLNTLVNFLARRQARMRGCHEGLLVARDGIREGASSNIFVVCHGAIVTPPEHLVIAGVTRDVVIRLAREAGYRLVFRTLPVEGIPTWEEAFITSTSRHIMPLTRVDGRPIGSGDVGPVTRHLMAAFDAYFREKTAKEANA